MKKIGLLGGLGPESTVDYYKTIIKTFADRYPELAYPEILVYSVNLNEAMAMVNVRNWEVLSGWILEKLGKLHQAGADFAAIASNTPHRVFDRIAPIAPLPLISIVEATCAAAHSMKLQRCGLMGTLMTMESSFYRDIFSPRGMEIVTPSRKEQEHIHQRIFGEIELGIFKDSTRNELLSITRRMIDDEKIDALLLACTELPLILTESSFGIPFLNTTAIHCEAIVQTCLA